MAGAQADTVFARIERTDGGIIARYEKPVLAWLADRLPASVLPDHLTALGVFGALLTALSLCASHFAPEFLWLALLGLVANWLGDSLDGTIARRRQIERPRYGFFVDHLSDVASLLLILVGLGLSPLLRLDCGCLALVGYLVLMIFTLTKLHVSHTMQLSYFGVGPTEARIVIAVGLVLAAVMDAPQFLTPIGRFTPFDLFALAMFAFSLGSAVVMFAHHANQLAKVDPLRHAGSGEPIRAEEVRAVERPAIPSVSVNAPMVR